MVQVTRVISNTFFLCFILDISSRLGIIVNYLIKILKGFVIGIRRYPILAAVYIDTSFSLTCATLYVWFDYSITIVYSSFCRTNFYDTEKEFNTSARTLLMIDYYGIGSKLIFFQLISDIPRYLCLAYVSVKLPMLLIKRIRMRKSNEKRLSREKQNLLYSSLPYSSESIYVKRLLNMHRPAAPTSRLASLFLYVYEWRDDFRFSSRVISIYAVVFLMLFFIILEVSQWIFICSMN